MTSITFFFFLIPILSVVLLAVNFLFATHTPYEEKNSAFECGFHSFLGQNRMQFNISFYIFGLLFLLFDLEILLIYPYPVSSYFNSIYGLSIMLVFFIVLTLGFAFELGKNALKIDSRQYETTNLTYKSKLIESNIFSIINKYFLNIFIFLFFTGLFKYLSNQLSLFWAIPIITSIGTILLFTIRKLIKGDQVSLKQLIKVGLISISFCIVVHYGMPILFNYIQETWHIQIEYLENPYFSIAFLSFGSYKVSLRFFDRASMGPDTNIENTLNKHYNYMVVNPDSNNNATENSKNSGSNSSLNDDPELNRLNEDVMNKSQEYSDAKTAKKNARSELNLKDFQCQNRNSVSSTQLDNMAFFVVKHHPEHPDISTVRNLPKQEILDKALLAANLRRMDADRRVDELRESLKEAKRIRDDYVNNNNSNNN